MNRTDPYAGYNFRVEIDGITSAGFKNCSGLDTSQNATTYREGTDKQRTLRKIPGGLITYSDITLSRGITGNLELWQWRKQIMDGTTDRRNISIVLMDENQAEVLRWNLRNCWPTKWSGPTLEATSEELVVETLELAHEGITLG